jgi:hypothetical protein
MKPMYNLQEAPPLETVVGKYLVTSQFCEPKRYDTAAREFVYLKWNELYAPWWKAGLPDIFDDRRVNWGSSTWLINADGTLTFSGANYDSSG